MPKAIQTFRKPIETELKDFEEKFFQSMRTNVPLLDRITHYIVRRKGKQMRPMFVFLTAKLLGEMNEKTFRAASLIELIHTASLVHDDVVDDSHMRRGFFSLNALWKNKIAVLVGDYLLSKSLILSTENEDFDLLKVISHTMKLMSEGELLQIEKARKLNITEEVYYDIIRQKTAALIAACCEAGTRSLPNSSEEDALKMRKFGENIGMAFQIKDDLFDYTNSNLIGKPIGIDIKERKMTLPLIYALQNSSKNKQKWILTTIKKHNTNKKRVQELIAYVKETGGLEYAVRKMMDFRDHALAILTTYPENEYRIALQSMVDYVIEREK